MALFARALDRGLVERIMGIASLIKKRQADGALFLRLLEVLRADTVGVHEIHNHLPHLVGSSTADEMAGYAHSSRADDGIKTATSGHGRNGLPVLEKYVKDGLPHPNDFAHI